MAEQFLQQPDGKWAIYSTVTDCLTGINFTEEELISYAIDQARICAERETREYIEQKRNGGKVSQFSVDWEEAKARSLKSKELNNNKEFLNAIKAIGA